MEVTLVGIFFIVAVTCVQLIVFRKINKSVFFSPVLIHQATLSISLATILSIYFHGVIEYNLFVFLLSVAIFHLGIVLFLSYFFPIRVSMFAPETSICKMDYQIFWFVVLLCLVINFLYSYLLWSSYSTGDERLLLNRVYRTVSIFKELFSIWAVSIVSYFYAIYKKKLHFFIFIVILCFLTLSGSKSIVLYSFLVFMFFYMNFNSVKFSRLLLGGAIIVVTLFLPSLIMYGGGFYDIVFHRIFMSADIYSIALELGDFRELYDFYEPVSYVLHPFTSVIGIRGYDHPLGAEILSTLGKEVNGTGPNAHLNILSLVLYDGDYLSSSIFFSFICILLLFSWFFMRYILYHNYFGVSLKAVVFVLYYSSLYALFIDIGLAQFNLVMILVSTGIWFGFKILSDFSKR